MTQHTGEPEHRGRSRRLLDEVDRQPLWVLAVLATLVCLVVYLPTARWDYGQVNDTRATAAGAWLLLENGSFQVDESWPDIPWTVQGQDGNWYVERHPGAMAWTALFYLPVPRNPSVSSVIDLPFGPAALSGAFATALGIGAMVLLLGRLVPRRTALLGALLLAFGTSNWTVSSEAAWNHGPTLLFLTLALLAESRARGGWAGLSLAAAITVRPPVAIAAATLGIGRFARERDWGHFLKIGLVSSLGLGLMVAYYTIVFGEPLMRPGFAEQVVTRTDTRHGLNWAQNVFWWLFDPGRGLFVFSPFLLLVLPAIPKAWRTAPDWVRWAAVGGVLYAVFNTRVTRFQAGGGFFGYRGPLETVTLIWPLVVVAWHEAVRHVPRWRDWTAATAGAAVLIFAAGSLFAGPPQRHDTYCRPDNFVGAYRPQAEILESQRLTTERCLDQIP